MPRMACLAGKLRLSAMLLCALAAAPSLAVAATWQYYVPFDTGRAATDGQAQPGRVFLWLPPDAKTIRGVLAGGQLGIELEIALDAEVRKTCAENGLAIVYFVPHISGVFHYWADGNTDAKRRLKAFADLAQRSGHPELARVPWITMGHSTAGIFCRNVAYAWPERVAGILHLKSGNFHQKDHLPPTGSLAGVPLVAINGQFESFGPEGGIRPELGRETQWVFVRRDIERFKEKDPNHLMSIWLDLGGDHFHGSAELSQCAAMFIHKTAKYLAANRWGSLSAPAVKGEAQSIEFPPVAELKAGGAGCELKARASSGLPVCYEVDYGPVAVKDGKLTVSDLPRDACLPIECRVTAYQIGRRTSPAVAAAAPVWQAFNVVKP